MAWLYLIAAGLCEIAWPVGLKLSQTPGRLASGPGDRRGWHGRQRVVAVAGPAEHSHRYSPTRCGPASARRGPSRSALPSMGIRPARCGWSPPG